MWNNDFTKIYAFSIKEIRKFLKLNLLYYIKMRLKSLIKSLTILFILLSFVYFFISFIPINKISVFAIFDAAQDNQIIGTNLDKETENTILDYLSLLGIANLVGLILVIIIFITIIIILKKLNDDQKIILKNEKDLSSKYINLLKQLSPKEKNFDKFSKLVRDYFKETLGLNYNLTYLELAKKFKENKNHDVEKFCSTMSIFNYSGTDMKNEDIKSLMNYFSKILTKN